MYQKQIAVLKDSIKQATQQQGTKALSAKMFEIFFQRYPEAQEYFAEYNLAQLGDLKFQILTEIIVDTLEFPNFASGFVDEEVYRHFHVHSLKDREYYFGLIDAIYEAIKIALNTQWNEQVDKCWRDAIAGMRYNIDIASKENIKTANV
ncbi:MAG: hypothetical protein V7746_22750 [Halioglobus sp.]